VEEVVQAKEAVVVAVKNVNRVVVEMVVEEEGEVAMEKNQVVVVAVWRS
jgi:hypothetical protein